MLAVTPENASEISLGALAFVVFVVAFVVVFVVVFVFALLCLMSYRMRLPFLRYESLGSRLDRTER